MANSNFQIGTKSTRRHNSIHVVAVVYSKYQQNMDLLFTTGIGEKRLRFLQLIAFQKTYLLHKKVSSGSLSIFSRRVHVEVGRPNAIYHGPRVPSTFITVSMVYNSKINIIRMIKYCLICIRRGLLLANCGYLLCV